MEGRYFLAAFGLYHVDARMKKSKWTQKSRMHSNPQNLPLHYVCYIGLHHEFYPFSWVVSSFIVIRCNTKKK